MSATKLVTASCTTLLRAVQVSPASSPAISPTLPPPSSRRKKVTSR